jgi:hypothetical protein
MTAIIHNISKSDITLELSVTVPRVFKLRTWVAMRFIILAGMVAPFTIEIATKGEGE